MRYGISTNSVSIRRILGAVICIYLASNLILAHPGKTISATFPTPLGEQINHLKQQCIQAGGIPSNGDETVKTADLTGDGIPDYVFFVGDYKCQGNESLFAPTAATGVEADLYIGSTDGNDTRAWSGTVFGTDIKTKNGLPILIVYAAGTACGESSAPKSIAGMTRCDLWIKYSKAENTWQPIIISKS
jgi:hypothetical protein